MKPNQSKKNKKIPEFILKNIRQNQGLASDDSSKDKEFEELSLEELTEMYFAWEGYIGFSHAMIEVITALQKAGYQ